jgi:hypothetical protein
MKNDSYLNPLTGKILVERRSGADRRGPASISAYISSRERRRKSKGRRRTDRGAYVDVFDSRSWSIAIAVLILSFTDAVLTGLHVIKGTARELNPVMKAVIMHAGLPAFFGMKAAMTALPVAVILIHKEWTLGRFAALLCLLAYILITFYHLYLLFGAAKLASILFGSGM